MTDFTTRRSMLRIAAAGAAVAVLPRTLWAESDYPNRQINYLIPYKAGGMSDSISRIVGEKLTQITGQNVVNDYKPGAGGMIAANYYAGVEPDGYTIMQSTNSFYSLIPQVNKVTYDPAVDFTPLVLAGDAPMVIATSPQTGVKSLADLVSYAKEKPEGLAYGTAGKGTVGHLCGVWLQNAAGIKLLHIPYEGGTAALQACLSGETQIFFGPEAAEPILAGQLVGLGVMGAQRWDKLPEIQTTVEAGFEGWAPRSWHTVTILSAVPDPIKEKLAAMLGEILADPSVEERIRGMGLIPGKLTMAELRQRATDDFNQFGGLLKSAGII